MRHDGSGCQERPDPATRAAPGHHPGVGPRLSPPSHFLPGRRRWQIKRQTARANRRVGVDAPPLPPSAPAGRADPPLGARRVTEVTGAVRRALQQDRLRPTSLARLRTATAAQRRDSWRGHGRHRRARRRDSEMPRMPCHLQQKPAKAAVSSSRLANEPCQHLACIDVGASSIYHLSSGHADTDQFITANPPPLIPAPCSPLQSSLRNSASQMPRSRAAPRWRPCPRPGQSSHHTRWPAVAEPCPIVPVRRLYSRAHCKRIQPLRQAGIFAAPCGF